MSSATNKVEWCLRKAENELKISSKHRGLVKIEPNILKARAHLHKAEHYLRATEYLKLGNYSDISASTVFYSMYHSLLAIAAKFGYVSRNQDCTFALMYNLIDESKIKLEKELLEKISALNPDQEHEKTSLDVREEYQYGTTLSIKDDLYKELFGLARTVISKAKVIIEQ